MKIDQVQGPKEISATRERDDGRAVAGASGTGPAASADEVRLSSSAKAVSGPDAEARVAGLQSELQHGPRLDAQALADRLIDEGVVW